MTNTFAVMALKVIAWRQQSSCCVNCSTPEKIPLSNLTISHSKKLFTPNVPDSKETEDFRSAMTMITLRVVRNELPSCSSR